MKKLRTTKGFTLLETIVVVGIVAILAAIGILEFAKYQRQLDQLKLDSTARQIFVAAQNHLSMAEGQGYLLREEFGNEETERGVYWFVAGEDGSDPDDTASVLNLMLPFGSIEESVRTQGSYIIRYQKYPAAVLDVFYAQGNMRRGHSFDASEYDTLMSNYRGDEKKSARRSYSGSVIGYYGGVEAQDIETGAFLQAPVLKVINSDTLYVEVTNPNFSNINASLNLIITGKQSGESVTIPLVDDNGNLISGSGHYISSDTEGFKVILDDITSATTGFKDLFCTGDNKLLPGEDIVLHAVAYSNKVYTNVAESAQVGTNSLFANTFDIKDSSNNITGTGAGIASFRHLENLNPEISGLDSDMIDAAEQLGDLVWAADGEVFNSSAKIYAVAGTSSDAGVLVPVDPTSGLKYDGGDYSIENAVFNADGDAGVFGTLSGGSVSNLELVGLSVSSETRNAGALAGSASGTVFSGVLVHNDNSADDKNLQITGKLSTGGLAGYLNGGSVSMSAAAVYVKSSSGEAGGLIGKLEGTSVQGSYSGGHTVNARFTDVTATPPAGRINVQGKGTAGGLIGSASGNFSVSACYSTASCLAQNPGGLIGTANSGTVTNSYAAGRVLSSNGNPVGAFFGTHSSVSCSGKNFYLLSVSENVKTETIANVEGVSGKDTEKTEFILPETSKLPAMTYDSALVTGYEGKFSFPTVSQLNSAYTKAGITNRHVGDWQIPSLEVMPFTLYNDDTLRLIITPDDKTSVITLAVTGQTSAHTQVFQLNYDPKTNAVTVSKQGYVGTNTNSIIWETGLTSTLPVRYDNTSKKIEVIFDDITVAGRHFSEIFGKGTLKFEAGENIDIRLGSGTASWAELSQLTPDTTNSLFATNSTFTGARIAYVRHLQNLDPAISSVSSKVTGAVLTRSISWNGSLYPAICKNGSNSTSVSGGFYGIYNPNLTEFAGTNYTLSGFVINSAPSEISSAGAGNAGLFRLVGNSMNVSKLMLKDFSVSATGNAAALAAEVTGGLTADTVLAASGSSVIIKSGSTGAAGGLVGEAKGTVELKNSAASMLISSSAQAGGLVGLESSGSLSIHECYAGGHTDGNKTFSKDSMNITGTASGGIIGEAKAGSLSIANSFGAASVSGSSAGGGIIGQTAVSATLNLVYTVAPTAGIKVKEADSSTASGAFIGQTASGAKLNNTNCYYLPEIYPGATMINGASTVAYAGQGASLAAPVMPANYEKDGSGNIISAKISGSTMQARTYPYDAKLKRDGNEFPFSIWTSFNFESAGKKAGGTKTGIYYGDWQPVVISATVLHEITFKYADPLDSGTVKPVDDTNLGVQKIREGEDNSLLIPYIKNIVGYSITGWQIQGTSVVLHEENGFLAVPAEYITGDITVVAMYEKNDGYYTISFYYDPTGENKAANMELIGSVTKVQAGTTKYSDIKTPSRNITDRYFDGWYADTDFDEPIYFSSDDQVVGDIHAYARYIPLEYYTVTIDFNYRITDSDTPDKIYSLSNCPQYKLQQVQGKNFDEYLALPDSGFDEPVIVVAAEADNPSGSYAEMSGEKLHISTDSTSRYTVTFEIAKREVKLYKYQVIYRLQHTKNNDINKYDAAGVYDYTYKDPSGKSEFEWPVNEPPTNIPIADMENYKFVSGPEISMTAEGTVMDGKVYVYYDRKTFTLSFNTNGGTPVIEPTQLYFGQTLSDGKPKDGSGADVKPERTGHIFADWKLAEKVSGTAISKGWSGTMPACDVVASANWNDGYSSYQVMYYYEDAEGGGYTYVGSYTEENVKINTTVRPADKAGYKADLIHSHATGFKHTWQNFPGATSTGAEYKTEGCSGYYQLGSRRIIIDNPNGNAVKDGYISSFTYRDDGTTGKLIYVEGTWYEYKGNKLHGDYEMCNADTYSLWVDQTHFSYDGNISGNKQTYTVKDDGSTVVKVYFKRNSYTITFTKKGSGCDPDTELGTITAKYDAPIKDKFPFKDASGKVHDYVWEDVDRAVFNGYVLYVDRMPGTNVTLRNAAENSGNTSHIRYYMEVFDDESYDVVRFVGTEEKHFKQYGTQIDHNLKAQNMDSLGQNEFFQNIEGYSRWGWYAGDAASQNNAQINAAVSGTSEYEIKTYNEFYYCRADYSVELYVGQTQLTQSPTVTYGDKLTEVKDIRPDTSPDSTVEYSFAWYVDSACTDPVNFNTYTMPASNIVLYGKWEPPTYHVSFYTDADCEQLYKGPYDVKYNDTLDGVITNADGSMIFNPPSKTGYTFDGWYFADARDSNAEKQYTVTWPVRYDNMKIYAKWLKDSQGTEPVYHDVTVYHGYYEGTEFIPFEGESELYEHKQEHTSFQIDAISKDGWTPTVPFWMYYVTEEDIQEYQYVYTPVEPWFYDIEYYAEYDSIDDTSADPGYTFSGPTAYFISAERDNEAVNQFETISFSLPDGYENYHLKRYDHSGNTGSDTVVIIGADEQVDPLERVTLKFYLEPDPTRISIEDRYRLYDGQAAPSSEAGITLTPPAEAAAETLVEYKYRDAAGTAVDNSAVVNAGMYQEDACVILKVNGTAVGESASSEKTFLLWKNDESLNLRIGKRSVTLTSATAEQPYSDTPLTRSDPVADITVEGDGFVTGEGVDISFSVDAFRLNAGTSSNAFTYEFSPGTDPDNYEITTVFGTLSVYWKYRTDYYYVVSSQPDAVTPDELEYPLSSPISGLILPGTEATEEEYDSVEIPVVIPADFSTFSFKEPVTIGGTAVYNEETGFITLTPEPGAEKAVLKIYLGPDTDLISFADLTAKAGEIPVFSTYVTSAAVAGYQADLYYVYRYFDAKDVELTKDMFYDAGGNVLSNAPALEEGRYKVYAYAMLRMYEPVTDPNETPIYCWFVLKQQVDGKLKLTVS